jgi:hypothetical protein
VKGSKLRVKGSGGELTADPQQKDGSGVGGIWLEFLVAFDHERSHRCGEDGRLR